MKKQLLRSRAMHFFLLARRRFYKFLFGTPTTVIEALNGTCLLVWAAALLSDDMVMLPQYSAFFGARMSRWNECAALLFAGASVFAFFGAVRNGYFANRVAGYALQFSALLWLCVSLNFYASHPPINTGMFVYAVMAAFCWVTGNYLWTFAAVLDKRCEGCSGQHG